MPQVPDSFVPSATVSPLGVSPLSAEGVQPIRNRAPEQQLEAGAAVQRLGQETVDIGQRIQSQLDNAMAKQAETGFLNKVLDITNGDGTDANPGYLNLKGQAAVDGYNDAATAIAKAKQEGQAGLADDFQKNMYNRVTAQHLLNFGRQMADHRFQQTAQYSAESAINRANAYATNAAGSSSSYGQTDLDGNPTGEFQRNLRVAEQETLDGVRIMKGDPAGSANASAALVNLHTQIGVSTLSQMMDARAPFSKVQAMYDDMKSKDGSFAVKMQQPDGSTMSVPGLDGVAIDKLGKMVKAYSDQESTRTAVSQSLSDAVRASQGQPTSSSGTPDYQFPIKGATVTAQNYAPAVPGKTAGGVTLQVPQGSSIQAPAAGKVTQVGRDGDDNFSMKIEHPDGSVTSFTGLSTSNVQVGDTVERGEDVAASGAADGKTSSVLWSLTSAAGKNVDPTKAGLAPVDLTKVTDEKVLGAALDSVRKQITDPYLQQQATSEMESLVRHNQQMKTAADTQTFKTASDAFYSGGMNWRSIPPSVFTQLPPERQQQFKDLQTEQVLKNYNQGQAFKTMGETDAVATFFAHPEVLTQANVDAVRPQLTNSAYLQLTERATALQNNPKGVIAASQVAERVKFWANDAGIKDPDDKKQSDADKQNYTSLMHKVTADIDQIKAQNHGKATAEQVEKVIQDETRKIQLTMPRTGWGLPLVWTGISPTTESSKFKFQVPKGTTRVVPMSDGTVHYYNGTTDLGEMK